MFNSGILDVAIGMIFIYLLLSLITSAANEVIELWLKNRAADLERGIRELIDPGKKPNESSVVQQVYDHPLISGLFGGKYKDSGIANVGKYIKRTALPSYIPARNFALAIMDLALPATNGTSGTTGAAPLTAGGSVRYSAEALRDALFQPGSILPESTRKALVSLIDAAGNDATKARENIENWFNSSMDRVSGWYKRRSQIIIFVIGFVIAFAVNPDSVLIAKRLAADKPLRESLATAAEEYARANANATPTPTPSPSPSPSPTPPAGNSNSNTNSNANSNTNSNSNTDKKPTGATTTNGRTCPPTCKDVDSPECKLKRSLCDLESLGLPIGWEYENDLRRKWPGTQITGEGGWLRQIYWHFLGWLITALAISLGAPFWFDLLNKVIVVRSTVKPKEKSPEEKSKD